MIIISPTSAWLESALSGCSRSFTASSPYIGEYFAKSLSDLRKDVSITVLTRTLITDFASRASDLEAVCKVAARANGLLSLSSLHAKVYVVDDMRALVTSANATFSGMKRNRECGLEVTSEREVHELFRLIKTGFGVFPTPKQWTVEDLEGLREPVKILQASLPKSAKNLLDITEGPLRLELPRRRYNQLVGSFSGWLRLTIEGVSKIESATFTMEQVWSKCLPLARSSYPDNHHVRPKLRQQMQRLRDLGLVSFLGNGRYERLANPR